MTLYVQCPPPVTLCDNIEQIEDRECATYWILSTCQKGIRSHLENDEISLCVCKLNSLNMYLYHYTFHFVLAVSKHFSLVEFQND